MRQSFVTATREAFMAYAEEARRSNVYKVVAVDCPQRLCIADEILEDVESFMNPRSFSLTSKGDRKTMSRYYYLANKKKLKKQMRDRYYAKKLLAKDSTND